MATAATEVPNWAQGVRFCGWEWDWDWMSEASGEVRVLVGWGTWGQWRVFLAGGKDAIAGESEQLSPPR